MFNFKIIVMSEEFVQAVKKDLFYDEIPDLRKASLVVVNILDSSTEELPLTLIVARQVNVNFIEVLDKISEFVKEVETQNVNTSYAFRKALKLKIEFHITLETVKKVGHLVQTMPETKEEVGN